MTQLKAMEAIVAIGASGAIEAEAIDAIEAEAIDASGSN